MRAGIRLGTSAATPQKIPKQKTTDSRPLSLIQSVFISVHQRLKPTKSHSRHSAVSRSVPGFMPPELSAPTAPEAPWRAGVRGARANLLPGIALQLGALALVIAYYRHAPTRETLERLAAWRTELGLTYSIVSTALFAGLIPMLYLWANPATRATYNVRQGAWLTFFWAYKGLEIDLWYRLLAHVIGEGADARTIAIKTFLDQFVYCPIFAVPLTMFGY